MGRSWFDIKCVLMKKSRLVYIVLYDSEGKRIDFSRPIDILLYGDEKINTPDLIIPHPRMKERDFVLIPLREIM